MAKIKSIETLDREIARLQTKAKDLEGKLDDSFDYLQDNYSSMIMNSVIGKATGSLKSGITGTVLNVILSNERLASSFSKIVNDLLDKAATGIDRLAEKMAKKKEDPEEENS